MARYHAAGRTYEGAERFVDAALRRDDSLFTPGRAIWTAHLLDELDERFIRRPDMRTDANFDDKLRGQLADASPEAIQLMAEVVYLYVLPARWTIGGPAKRARVNDVLSMLPTPVAIPADLDRLLDDGVGSGGSAFSMRKPAILAQLIRYIQAWKRLDQASRDAALADPWAFKAVLVGVPVEDGAHFARESLLHVVHPDTFERIFSSSEKQRVIAAVADLAPANEEDADRKLWLIRQALGPRLGADFDWYDTVPARALWHAFDDRWTGLVFWAGRFHGLAGFDAEERTYKLAVADRMVEAREAVLAGADDWIRTLKRAYGPPNNITSFHAHGAFLRWVEENQEKAREILLDFWEGPNDPLTRFSRLCERVPMDVVGGRGTRTNVLGLMLLALDRHGLPPYKVRSVERAMALGGYDAGEANDEADLYRGALTFFDELIRRARSDGLELRDRLDAQSVAWCASDAKPRSEWPPEEQAAFLRWRSSLPVTDDEAEDEEEVVPVDPPQVVEGAGDAIAELAERLLLDVGALREIASLLDHKRQVVFYGPPGTGKTYVARELAWALSGARDRVRLVQFHPSYAYEDFIEGYRPRVGGDAGFELRDGPFKALAQAALADRAHDYYLVIDEMNRGNVAKVLGELYFLLEYRDERIQLQYSAEPFELPPNLRIIATMNTADRSIALLDAALRRRFAFIPFFPDRPPVEGLLRRWLLKHRNEMAWVADVVDRANSRLADRNGAIGPSFFLKSDLDADRLDRIWRHEILPYLEDHFFDDPERLRDFDLRALRAVGGPATEPLSAPEPLPAPESVAALNGEADAAEV